MQNQTQNVNQNSRQNKNKNQLPKKETLFLMAVKTLLVVLIFTALAVIIIGGGYIIGEYSKNEANKITTKPVDQETENYYDALEKKCADGKCCLHSLRIMKENNYKEIDQNGNCPKGLEKSFLPLKGIAGFCQNSLKWCQPIQTKIISIETDKTEYFMGEEIQITIKNETDKVIFIPDYFTIERFNNIEWEGVERDACPWDKISRTGYYLNAHSDSAYDWNQETKECDMSKAMTIREQVQTGKYRVKILRNVREEENKNKEEIIYSNEFTIREKENIVLMKKIIAEKSGKFG